MLKDRPAPPSVSQWWWLLPPMRYLLEHRRWKARQQEMMDALNPLQRNALVQYMNKTTGWSFVGFGGFLIAIKERRREPPFYPLQTYCTLLFSERTVK
ncbi:hypothetical protein [Amycolatopsis sp. H20-H5]|uniref:hypothetical protein n=1 Tax=Amycolatopsis sp. H20-H5 TaxID=3046309 RepID=UPI002DBF3C46|nr:hypothetical protein [Amycolatopsis sp. H20-H5]MEC3974376.1 hypothetical protein [Amycolatopsis sp. H20-H5]